MKKKRAKKPISRRMLALIGIGAAAFAYVYFFALPTIRATTEYRKELEQKRNEILEAVPLIEENRQLSEDLEKIRGLVDKWHAETPSSHSIAALFGKITDAASSSGVQIRRFNPEGTDTLQLMERVRLSLECQGSFRQFHLFLKKVEELPPTIWIDRLRIDSNDSETGAISAELTLSIFADNQGESK